ncbi:MAG TPA: alpha/beta hydrolase [Acidobacteriota bacterium]|nr:alpha/beta hydrolase [Acidobacteriota bacterium]
MKNVILLCFCLVFMYAQAEDTIFAKDLVRYLGIQNKVSDEDLVTLTQLKSKAESPKLTVEEKKAAYKELFQTTARMMESTPPPALYDMLVSSAISWTCAGESEIAKGTAKPGELGNVIKQGNGEISLILIPDVGMDGTVFQSFLNRNKEHFTMYAVTLPGFGGTPKLPDFEKRDYAATRLWKNAESAVINLIQKENLKAPIILGHQGGAYLALRIALDHPESVSGAVVLNGLLYAPMMLSKDPTGKLTPELRHQVAKLFMPIELFPRPSRDCFAKYWQSMAGSMSKDQQHNLQLAQIGGNSDAHLTWDYGAELLTTDLTNEMDQLKIPTLVVSSIPDPKKTSPNSAVDQWKIVHNPSVKVVTMENVGTFPVDDDPKSFDKMILDFAATKSETANK